MCADRDPGFARPGPPPTSRGTAAQYGRRAGRTVHWSIRCSTGSGRHGNPAGWSQPSSSPAPDSRRFIRSAAAHSGQCRMIRNTGRTPRCGTGDRRRTARHPCSGLIPPNPFPRRCSVTDSTRPGTHRFPPATTNFAIAALHRSPPPTTPQKPAARCSRRPPNPTPRKPAQPATASSRSRSPATRHSNFHRPQPASLPSMPTPFADSAPAAPGHSGMEPGGRIRWPR